MLLIINLLILCIVLFVYIHIYTHIKTSNYLEIYEIENPSKDKFEDLVSMKQPLVINNSANSRIQLKILGRVIESINEKIRYKIREGNGME